MIGCVFASTAHGASFSRISTNTDLNCRAEVGHQIHIAHDLESIGFIIGDYTVIRSISPIVEDVARSGCSRHRTGLTQVIHAFATAYRAIGRIVGWNIHGVFRSSVTKDDLVLFRHEYTCIIGSVVWVVVRAGTSDTNGLISFSDKWAAIGIGVTVRVIVNNQNNVGSSIIVEGSGEIDGCPCIAWHGDIAAKHDIIFRYGNPIRVAFKSRLVGGDHVNGEIACFGTEIVELHTGNLSRSTHFSRGVNLLRQGIVWSDWQIIIVANRITNGNTIIDFTEMSRVLVCLSNWERACGIIISRIWISASLTICPPCEHIARIGCSRYGARLVGGIASSTACGSTFFRIGNSGNHKRFSEMANDFHVTRDSESISCVIINLSAVPCPIVETVAFIGRGGNSAELTQEIAFSASAYRTSRCRICGNAYRINTTRRAENDLVFHRHKSTCISGRIGRIVVCARTSNTNGLIHILRVEGTTIYIGIVRVWVVIHNQYDILCAIIFENIVEIDGGPIPGKHVDTAAKHLVVFRHCNPVGSAFKFRLGCLNHINVHVASDSWTTGVVERNTWDFARRCS